MNNTVTLSIDNQIAHITLNRPNSMNAFNHEMAADFEIITNQVKLDKNIRAVLLTGAGKLFMAGGDLHFFHEHLDEMPGAVLQIMRQLNASINNIQQMEKPVLAAVHGSVAGVGLSIMLACDLVIAEENTKFTTAYSKIGLCPDGGATQLLTNIVGAKKAMELFFTADIFDSKEAKNLGLINRIVSQDNLQASIDALLQQLANAPTKALASTKALVNQANHTPLALQLESEVLAFSQAVCSDDFRRGITAFINKKPPQFQGN